VWSSHNQNLRMLIKPTAPPLQTLSPSPVVEAPKAVAFGEISLDLCGVLKVAKVLLAQLNLLLGAQTHKQTTRYVNYCRSRFKRS
jgi:hypothetical protein